MMNKVLCIVYFSKIANTGHQSYMFSVLYNSIQKVTNISITKPIIFISIMNKYDISNYLGNHAHTSSPDYQGLLIFQIKLAI